MDLTGVATVLQPRAREELPVWTPGMAALGGGTWLFSEPQPALDTLVDLAALDWPALAIDADGLHIAATCTIAALARLAPPPDWPAGALIGLCCDALLGSFKIHNMATVGGNICLALPAGPMTALAAALGGVATIWRPDGGDRQLAVAELVTGDRRTALAPGEILRGVRLPAAALRQRVAFRRMSLTALGRSAVLLIGTLGDGFALTVTAATRRPVRLAFARMPDAATLAARIDAAVTAHDLWHDDCHGDPAWRRHLTLRFAEQIRAELAAP